MRELAAAQLNASLSSLPMDWVLWRIDSLGILQLHEGPGVYRQGFQPGMLVGKTVWELFRESPNMAAFARRILCQPAAELVEYRGLQLLASGGPLPEGGASGLALVIGPAAVGSEGADDRAPKALELAEEIAEIGGWTGDLLVPGTDARRAYLMREVSVDDLPMHVCAELLGQPSARQDGTARDRRPLRERAAHLRLIS